MNTAHYWMRCVRRVCGITLAAQKVFACQEKKSVLAVVVILILILLILILLIITFDTPVPKKNKAWHILLILIVNGSVVKV